MSSVKLQSFCPGLEVLSNSLKPGDAHILQQIKPSLVQIMAWRLFGAKPLSEPMLIYRQCVSFQWPSMGPLTRASWCRCGQLATPASATSVLRPTWSESAAAARMTRWPRWIGTLREHRRSSPGCPLAATWEPSGFCECHIERCYSEKPNPAPPKQPWVADLSWRLSFLKLNVIGAAPVQLRLSDQQYYCLLRGCLY